MNAMKKLIIVAVVLLSFAASAGQASADPGKGRGHNDPTTSATTTSTGVTWESAGITWESAGVTWE